MLWIVYLSVHPDNPENLDDCLLILQQNFTSLNFHVSPCPGILKTKSVKPPSACMIIKLGPEGAHMFSTLHVFSILGTFSCTSKHDTCIQFFDISFKIWTSTTTLKDHFH